MNPDQGPHCNTDYLKEQEQMKEKIAKVVTGGKKGYVPISRELAQIALVGLLSMPPFFFMNTDIVSANTCSS